MRIAQARINSIRVMPAATARVRRKNLGEVKLDRRGFLRI
jgi:hypothetical protein